MFEVREGLSSLIDEERQDSSYQIIISFMPWATERTTGVHARLSRMMGGPAANPQINTFNVVPDESAIIQCVCKNDLRGAQTLFDLEAASARDVDSRGRSLINVGIAHKFKQHMSLLTVLVVRYQVSGSRRSSHILIIVETGKGYDL